MKSRGNLNERVVIMSGIEEKKKEQVTHDEKEPDLRGTFISVLFVGLFIIVSWVLVYALFIIR
jgi:hypothetical protein